MSERRVSTANKSSSKASLVRSPSSKKQKKESSRKIAKLANSVSLANNNNNYDDEEEEIAPGTSKQVLQQSNPISLARDRNLPISKIRHIMECAPSTEPVKISPEAVFAMARAAEAFVELLSHGAQRQANIEQRNQISYNDFSDFVHSTEQLSFIQDILPRKKRFSEVLIQMRKNKKQKR